MRRRGDRPRVAVVEEVHHRGRFAGHVACRCCGQADADALVARTLGDGVIHGLERSQVVRAHIEDQLVRADRAGRQQAAVDHQVRPRGHQQPVLVAARLAFRAVGDDHGSRAGTLRHVPPLGADRECGPAPPEEAAALELGDELAARPDRRQRAEPRGVRPVRLGACRERWARQEACRVGHRKPGCGEPGSAASRWSAAILRALRRHAAQAATARMQAALRIQLQAATESVPVPRPCSTASGHDA